MKFYRYDEEKDEVIYYPDHEMTEIEKALEAEAARIGFTLDRSIDSKSIGIKGPSGVMSCYYKDYGKGPEAELMSLFKAAKDESDFWGKSHERDKVIGELWRIGYYRK